ncbi:MAG: helix-hairpin-helix domain-containing protein, partial [Polyangiales bacterium]
MPVHNAEIADLFDRMAMLLEIQGANPFRVRAYRNAARTLGDLPRDVTDLIAEGEDLSELPAIGADLASKIAEVADTGHFSALTDLEKEVPAGLVDLTKLPGLGARRVRALYENLGVRGLEDLERAAKKHRIRALPGFGEKTELRILHALSKHLGSERRHKLVDVERVASAYTGYLEGIAGVRAVVVAGSYRRRQETIGDLDILVTCERGCPVVRRFVAYDEVDEVVSEGRTRSTVLLRGNLQVDLRVVPEVSYGAALYYFTGSKAHNIAVRKIAVEKKLKINEYGVFKGKKRVAGRTEDEIFHAVGLRYIEPELRENRGEIEAARENRLPSLVTLADIRGDLH